MSLKVWLPLDGNLENQGASMVTATNNGATVDTTGKIGSCYLFDGIDDFLTLNNFNPNGWPEISISAWVYPTADFVGLFLARGGGQHRIRISTNGFMFRDTNNTGTQREIAFSPTIPVNVWTHITCVYKRGEIWIYQNGIQIAHSTAYYHATSTLLSDMGEFRIGRQQSTSSNSYYTGKVNDFRIYDHALSAAEVHEISQGLVLHYKLDAINNNNILKQIPKSYNSSAYNAYQLNLTENLVENQTYTFQFWDIDVAHSGKTAANLGMSVYWGGGSVALKTMNGTSYFTNGHADYLSFTITITSAQASGSGAGNAWLNIYNSVSNANGTRSMHIGAWKVEKGNAATAYGLTSEELGSYIQDSSGYGHNGTIVGSPTLSSDTARYSASTYMNATSTTNHIDCGQMPSTVQTISFWFKKTGNSNFVVMAEPSSGLMFAPVGNYAVIKVAASNQTCYAISSPYYIDGQWNHIVVQKDGTTYKLWTNGVQRGSSGSNYYRHDGTDLWLFNRNYNANYAANGQISDFRVYTTLLSEADIKQLYEMGAKVDNKQNLHIYEAVEMQPTIKLTKQGQMKAGEFQEDTATKLYKTNQIIETNNLIEL